jgi:autotransporter-associated beta strand protein
VNAVRFASAAAGNAKVAFVFNNPNANKDTFDFGAGTISFGSLTGSGLLGGNSSGVHTISAGALGWNDVFSGTLVDQAGQVALTKVGTGTLTLTGANSYSGQTTVSNGELVVSTSFAGNGNVFVNAGATFGVTNLSGGSALVSNLTAAAGSALEFQNAASATTPLIAAGNVTVNGGCSVKITGTNGLVAGGSYPLVSYAGTSSGAFTNFQLQMPCGWRGALANVGKQIVLTNVAVVATTPPQLGFGLTNGQLQLNWPGDHTGWRLLMNTNMTGTNWVDVSPAGPTNQTTIRISTANAGVFYRLVYP